MIEIDANGAVLSKAIAAEAVIRVIGARLQEPTMWRVSMLQSRIIKELGFVSYAGALPPLNSWSTWSMCGYPVEECLDVPKDQIQLWDGSDQVALVKNLGEINR